MCFTHVFALLFFPLPPPSFILLPLPCCRQTHESPERDKRKKGGSGEGREEGTQHSLVSITATTEHVPGAQVSLLLLLLLLGGLGIPTRSSSSRRRSTPTTGRGKGRGVLEVSLKRVRLLEGELLQTHRNSHASLEGIGDGVREGGKGRVPDLQGDSSDVAHGHSELGSEVSISEIQDLGVEEGAVVVDGLDDQPVGEGEDVQLLQQGGLGVPDLVALLQDLHGGGDLNLTLGNLGGDLQRLEERGLPGVTPSRARGDDHIARSSRPDTSRGGHAVLLHGFTHQAELAVGEDKADVAAHELQELLDGVPGVLAEEDVDDLADTGVLPHQDGGRPTEGLADLLHLLRADIVDTDDEDLGVGAEELFDLLEVVLLLGAVPDGHGWIWGLLRLLRGGWGRGGREGKK